MAQSKANHCSQTVVTHGTMSFENNILWGNLKPSPNSADLYAQFGIVLRNNDIEILDLFSYGGPDPDTSGNLSLDPRFVGPGNYRLRSDSPLRNGGFLSPFGGFGTQDLDGSPRVLDDEVDIGAYEIDRLFADGFD